MTGHFAATNTPKKAKLVTRDDVPIITKSVTTPVTSSVTSSVTSPVTSPVTSSVTSPVTSLSDKERVKAWRKKNKEGFNASVRERRRKLKYDSEEEGT